MENFSDLAIRNRVAQLRQLGCVVTVKPSTTPDLKGMPYQVDIEFKGELIGTFAGSNPDQAAAIATEEAFMILEAKGVIRIM